MVEPATPKPTPLQDYIRRVHDFLSDQSKWTQKVNARDAHGERTLSTSPHARCWCITGAIIRLDSSHPRSEFGGHAVIMALGVIAKNHFAIVNSSHLELSEVIRVNDNLGYEATMRMLRVALFYGEAALRRAVQLKTMEKKTYEYQS